MINIADRSAAAAGLILFIIIIRAFLLHRLPKITFQIMWAVVILRLLIPFSVDIPAGMPQLCSRYQKLQGQASANMRAWGSGLQDMDFQGGRFRHGSLQSLRAKGEETKAAVNEAVKEGTAGLKYFGIGILPGQQGYGMAGEDAFASEKIVQDSSQEPSGTAAGAEQTGQLPEQNLVLCGIWLAGTVFCLLYFTASHLRCRRLYAEAIPADASVLPEGFKSRGRVKVSDRISAPLTYGILFPVILIPKIADWKDKTQLRMILEHEAVHIRRFDVLYKWIMTAAVCIHWFNPLVWAMYFLAGRDIELSCDEAVVKRFENGSRAEYALALLNFEEKRSLSPMFTRFSGNAVKERIEAIMKLNKTSVLSAVLAVILIAGTTTVFAGSKENGNIPAPVSSEENSTENRAEKHYPKEISGGSEVKQYLCEPSYYTQEEFEKAMAEERRTIENEVEGGILTREAADEMLEAIEDMLEDVRNGKQVQAPSPVFYSDGTPVVNSKGEQLYAKASDIEKMNEELRAKALLGTEHQEEDLVVTGNVFLENLQEDVRSAVYETAETELTWYTYEEYQEYVKQQKADYAAMLGEWGFDSINGWYEWTEEVIDEACRQLDENLEFIKKGGMISKPVEETDGTLMMGSLPGMFPAEAVSTEESSETVITEDYEEDALSAGSILRGTAVTAVQEGGEWDGEFLKEYEPYGIAADKKARYYLYNGNPVAGFVDKGFAVLVDGEAQENGGIYVRAVRDNGKLKELAEISGEEFAELSGLSLN